MRTLWGYLRQKPQLSPHTAPNGRRAREAEREREQGGGFGEKAGEKRRDALQEEEEELITCARRTLQTICCFFLGQNPRAEKLEERLNDMQKIVKAHVRTAAVQSGGRLREDPTKALNE